MPTANRFKDVAHALSVGPSGWACGPRIVMKKPAVGQPVWGRRPRLRRVSRPAPRATESAMSEHVRPTWTSAAGLESCPTIHRKCSISGTPFSGGDRPSRLFEDPYAAPLLIGRLKALAGFARLPLAGRLATHFLDLGWPRTRSSAAVRTRLIDDLVRQAMRGGARQPSCSARVSIAVPIAWKSSGTCRFSKSVIPPRRRPSASACRHGSGGCLPMFISSRSKPPCAARASTQMLRRWPSGKA